MMNVEYWISKGNWRWSDRGRMSDVRYQMADFRETLP